MFRILLMNHNSLWWSLPDNLNLKIVLRRVFFPCYTFNVIKNLRWISCKQYFIFALEMKRELIAVCWWLIVQNNMILRWQEGSEKRSVRKTRRTVASEAMHPEGLSIKTASRMFREKAWMSSTDLAGIIPCWICLHSGLFLIWLSLIFSSIFFLPWSIIWSG